jgi:serine/threonine-protein kinase
MANVGDPGGTDPGDRDERPEAEEPRLPPKRSASFTARQVAADPEPGAVVGGYALLERLGRGGAGSVFKVRAADGSICALKVLSASKVKRARVVQRFFDEVRAASAVKHPGLIQVLDFIEEEEPRRLAYAMEYLEGESLRDRLKRETTIGLREAMEIGAQICEALQALHDAGIIHRDLKPENIMVAGKSGKPIVKLLDFGVVKFLPIDPTAGGREEEKPGTFVGTPRYMAPEQAAGAAVDNRADLFSIGVILFEMITGRCPHEGDSLRDVVLAKLKGAPRITVNPEKEVLPQELTDLVDACLRLKPALRPKDASAVANGLREAEIVLFAVGAIKLKPDGTPVREPSGDLPELPPRASTPAFGASRPISRPGNAALEGTKRAPTSRPGQKPISAPRVPSSGREPAPSGRFVLRGAMIAIGMLAAAVVIAMIARGLVGGKEAVLVVPEAAREAQKVSGPRARIGVEVVTIPPGATVHVGATTFGPTPVAVRVERGQQILVTLAGYEPQLVDIVDEEDATITLTLAKTSTVQ